MLLHTTAALWIARQHHHPAVGRRCRRNRRHACAAPSPVKDAPCMTASVVGCRHCSIVRLPARPLRQNGRA